MDSHSHADEALLTAYALDELDASERTAVEAGLASDPAARQFVEATRATARALTDELAKEELPTAPRQSAEPPRRWPARLAFAAAACLVFGGAATAIMLRNSDSSPRREMAARMAMRPLQGAGEASAPAILDAEARFDTRYFAPSSSSGMTETGKNLEVTDHRLPAAKKELGLRRSLPAGGEVERRAGGGAQPQTEQRADRLAVRGSRVLLDRFEVARADKAGAVPGVVAPQGLNVAAGLDANDSVLLPADEFVADGGRPAEEGRAKVEAGRSSEREFNTEAYARIVDNPFLDVVLNPLSTFSIDVDTASYANVRRFLNGGQLPPPDAVRVEELVNYFPYDYAPPDAADPEAPPFAAHVEVAECPWAPEHRLVRVALKGKEIASHERPASNLVFLVDVSGSMNDPNKLPLVIESMGRLVEKLGERDRVAMVVYAGSSGLVLDSTPATPRNKQDILAALARLQAGGSTNGGQGIELAYATAASHFIQGGVNRVILCTDGDFNVGVTDQGSLTRLIEEKAKTGVFLSVLGFGMGNVKDATMEQLADKGNGNYAYIDTIAEGNKVLVEQMSGTLVTIAKDVKIQVEFNPAAAAAYRLIGYENRVLAKEDFNDDTKDAGEIGAGHTVTALYEVVPPGAKPEAPPAGVDPLRYQQTSATRPANPALADELLTLKLRYKQPDGDVSKLLEFPVKRDAKRYAEASGEFKFAASVAGFGMILRDSPHKGTATLGGVLEWAGEGIGADGLGYRREFVELVKKAQALKPQ